MATGGNLGERTVGSRFAVSGDDAFAALIDGARVEILELPRATVVSSITLDAAGDACAVGWVGAPSRLLVLEVHAGRSSIRMFEPTAIDPAPVAGLQIDAAVRLLATVGSHALVGAGTRTAVLATSATNLTPYPVELPAPVRCTGAGSEAFLVGCPAAIEEWNPQLRAARRRFRLSRPGVITAVGATQHYLWWTTQQSASRLEVMPMRTCGQPHHHDLPEPIAFVSSHPRSDLVACVGATSGAIYLVDVDGQVTTRTLATDGAAYDGVALVAAHGLGVVVNRGREVRWLPVDARPDAPGDRAPAMHVAPRDAEVAARTAASAPPSLRPAGVFAPGEAPVRDVAPASRDTFDDVGHLPAFGVVPSTVQISRSTAARRIERELKTIGIRALVAIAQGWDTRRIGFANESAHPFEQEVAAILGLNAGHATDRLDDARARLAADQHELANDPGHRGPHSPLGALASELGLSPLASDILMVVAAPALQGELARLYSVIANDPTRAQVDELLVHQVLGESSATRLEISWELEPTRPLVRFGLIEMGSRRRPFTPISVDPAVLSRLSEQPIEDAPGTPISVRRSDRDLSELRLPPALVRAALQYLSREPLGDRHARVALRGRAGSGRRTLLAALAARAGRDLAIIDVTRLPRAPDAFIAELRTTLLRAHIRRLVPCVTRTEDVTFEHAGASEQLRDVLRAHPGPLAIRLPPGAQVPFDPDHLTLDVPMPNEGERMSAWTETLGAHGLEVADPTLLATRYRIGPGSIHSAVSAVAIARAEEGRLGGDATEDVERLLRQARELRLGDHARRVERLSSWDALVLPDDTMRSLRELVGRVRHRRTVYESWGFDRTMSTSRGLTALFEGPPGTGKTMVAGVIARELGLELYQVDLSRIMSKWIGETEKNLGAVFDAAEDGQLVLLFDEADSLFAKRSEIKSSNDRFANLEVNYLLQRLDSFEGIAVLTTNFGASIDPAFQRRLSFKLTFPFPDEHIREQLWRVLLPAQLPITGRLDLGSLAGKYKLSGGYIRNACLRAAFLAASEGGNLSQQHLEQAVLLELAELGKLSTTSSVG